MRGPGLVGKGAFEGGAAQGVPRRLFSFLAPARSRSPSLGAGAPASPVTFRAVGAIVGAAALERRVRWGCDGYDACRGDALTIHLPSLHSTVARGRGRSSCTDPAGG